MADFALTLTGGDALAAQLKRLAAEAPAVVAEGLYQHAEEVMLVSKTEYVPVDHGTLRASGTVLPPEIAGQTVTVTLGYGGPAAPYAVAVHENPRSGHTGGVSPSGRRYRHWARTGGWKYLELPFTRMANRMVPMVAAAVEKWLTALGR